MVAGLGFNLLRFIGISFYLVIGAMFLRVRYFRVFGREGCGLVGMFGKWLECRSI